LFGTKQASHAVGVGGRLKIPFSAFEAKLPPAKNPETQLGFFWGVLEGQLVSG